MYQGFIELIEDHFNYYGKYYYLEHAEMELAKQINNTSDVINWGIEVVEEQESVIPHAVDLTYLDYLFKFEPKSGESA